VVIGGWRKLHNEELHNFYFPPSITEIIMSMRLRWAGYVSRMASKRNVYMIVVGKQKPLEDLDVDERIILR
jgi:hypothetical protein